jgi:L-threonylcarbamoyladenylate synthase
MSKPFLTVGKAERSPGGSLSVRHIDIVERTLKDLGYVLLPSDTAYSLAAIAHDRALQVRLNKILSRPDWPISLAFASASAAREWIVPDLIVDHLMERFCPGPITIVCKAKAPRVSTTFFDTSIASHDGTIGVRIPDSVVEREVAGCTNYPITTAAVRDLRTSEAVSDFSQALGIVSTGTDLVPDATWCAIEGEMVYPKHSTVVRVTMAGRLELIRAGHVPLEELERSVAELPATVFRNRG